MDKSGEIINLLFSDLIDEMAKELVEKEKVKGSQITSFDQKREALISQMEGSFEQKVGLLSKGMNIAASSLEDSERKELVKGADQMVGLLKKIETLDLQKSLHEQLGISEKTINAIYGVGYQLYKDGSVLEARAVLSLVTFLYSGMGDFWFLLGLCEHRLGNYEEALLNYGMCIGCSPKDPRGYFWTVKAAYHMKSEELMQEVLQMLSIVIDETDQAEEWKERFDELKREVS
ncbi:MAG: hypothetical protein WD595_04235 [Waddliaceae bacterium]